MAVKLSSVTVDATSLPGSISYLLWRTQSELARAWQRSGEHELTRHLATFDLLTLLASFPGISPSALAGATLLTPGRAKLRLIPDSGRRASIGADAPRVRAARAGTDRGHGGKPRRLAGRIAAGGNHRDTDDRA